VLRQDWETATTTAGREMLAIRHREEGVIVGVIEYLELNDRDGHPWIGLIMVHADRQREGIAGEAMERVCDHVNLSWASPVRIGVLEQNRAGLGLAVSLGFQPYGDTEQDFADGPQRLVLMERRA
jgi:RimJ/RimL family protein N-acetyltransferase